MVDRHLDERKPPWSIARHHLDADAAAVALERKALEDVAAEQAEVAVDVAQVQAEHRLHQVVVDAADDLAVQRIVALDLPALDNVDIGQSCCVQQASSRGSYWASPSV